jgi:hypothetical protein
MTEVFKKYDDDRDGYVGAVSYYCILANRISGDRFITLSFEEFLTGKRAVGFYYYSIPFKDS